MKKTADVDLRFFMPRGRFFFFFSKAHAYLVSFSVSVKDEAS